MGRDMAVVRYKSETPLSGLPNSHQVKTSLAASAMIKMITLVVLSSFCPTRFPPLRISRSHLLEWDNVFMGVVMKNSLIAAVLFGGFLAEPALPLIAATQAQKQTSEPAVPATAAPKTQKQPQKQIQTTNRSSRSSRRRNVARGAAGGAAGGAILGGGRGAAAGAVLGGTAGSLTRRRRR